MLRFSTGRSWTLPLLGLMATGAFFSISLVAQDEAEQLHLDLFKEQRFPSATTCKTCHPEHYREWSVSAHAYAQMSPVFNAMHGKILKLTNGTNGDFCIRCHTPVGMNLEEPEFISNLERHPTSREGVTCIACHRLDQEYGKISGRLAIVEGDIFDPVFGPSGNSELRRVIDSGEYGTNTDREKSGRAIHADAMVLDQIDKSGMCGTCHDVNLVNGFRLEEAFSEYKASPAARKGISCQDCHMGTEPGIPSGYATAPAAIVGGKPTQPRKRTNHMFAGPDYSIIHPGIFPHNVDAARLATIAEWLEFDHKAGWGTDEFERKLPTGTEFPSRWESVDDRYEAREILQDNFDLLDEIGEERMQIMRAGYQLGRVKIEQANEKGIRFKVEFRNGTDGHNVPTGFDAERLVWLYVSVFDSQGKRVFVSGDLDPNGDVRDSHSVYVHNGELPLDKHLFSLQSRFLTRMVRGGEREQVLAVNYSPDPLPFLRPSTSSTILTGRPVGARKHRQTIYPLGSKWAKYKVKRSQLEESQGPYRAKIQLKAAMVPVNLIYEIQDVGFDYGMSPREVGQAIVDGHLVLWEREVELKTP